MLRFAFHVLALALFASSSATAQTGPPELQSLELSDSVQVSLLTMMPGDQAYSLFGHSALRIRDAAIGLDRTYNYGTFDFDQPFFVARFLRGSLNYELATAPYEWLLMDYELQERPIIEQTLALDAPTSRALFDVLETNALPDNRSYRYDFFWDNCSTRILSALDSALARTGQPLVSLPPPDNPQTYRQLVYPYVKGQPLIHLGTDLALALPADAVASAREETFLPLELMAQLDRASVDGQQLVASRDTVFWLPDTGLPERAFPWPLVLGWVVFGGVAWVSWRGWRRGTTPQWLDVTLFGLVGLSGLILFLLWVATSHGVTGPNLNVLWAWPTHLVAAWGATRPSARWRSYFAVAALITGALILAWAVVPQVLPAAMLPIALAVALRSGLLGVQGTRTPQTETAP